MSSSDLVSIIIPTYNRAHLISETLDSIKAQTYTDWECIVVDDGSHDGTEHLLEYYAKNDSRFKYYKSPSSKPKGANACRNFGFEVSSGVFIQWFDSDDFMFEAFLEIKINAFKKKTDAILHRNKYSNYSVTRFRKSKFNYTKDKSLFYYYALDKIEIQTCGFMWKREFLKGKTLFDENIQRYQDNEFHIRMLACAPNVKILNMELAIIRGGDGDSSQISSSSSVSTKKLLDIFYYRYNTLKLADCLEADQKKRVYKEISKKAIWSFYEALKNEETVSDSYTTVMSNKEKLLYIMSVKENKILSIIKLVAYISLVTVFKTKFHSK